MDNDQPVLSDIDYHKKYLKYKYKYLELKEIQEGGFINLLFSPKKPHQTKTKPKTIPKWLTECREMNDSRKRSGKTEIECRDPNLKNK
jgi:hypothetical protein